MQFTGCWNALSVTVRTLMLAIASMVVAPALLWYSRKFRRILDAPLSREILKHKTTLPESGGRDIVRYQQVKLRNEPMEGFYTENGTIVPLAGERQKGWARSGASNAELRDDLSAGLDEQDARITVAGCRRLNKSALAIV